MDHVIKDLKTNNMKLKGLVSKVSVGWVYLEVKLLGRL